MTRFEIKKLGTTWCVAERDGMEVTSHSFRTRKAAVEFVDTSKKNQLKTVFEKLSDEQKKQIESKADFADELYTIGFEKITKIFQNLWMNMLYSFTNHSMNLVINSLLNHIGIKEKLK